MNPILSTLNKLTASLVLIGALAAAPSVAQAAGDGPYRMEVLVNGSRTPEYRANGVTYVEARKGREYAVRLTNNTGSRVAVALSVDGLNSIDAKHTSAAAARKWILGPYESIVVNGWQTSSDTARQFYFTSESGSYGAWLGKTRDLGNISAAFFREAVPAPPPRPYFDPEDELSYDDRAANGPSHSRADAAEKRSAPSASMAAKSREAAGGASVGALAAPSYEADEPAATGIGRERQNSVYTVEFRQASSPSAVVTVRYEYRKQLIEMGILPRPYRPEPTWRRETSSGFSDYGYAPDPYQGR